MRDLISRVITAIAVMLLALVHPRVTTEAVMAAVAGTGTTAGRYEEPAAPVVPPPRNAERVRPYFRAPHTAYAFGSPHWWEAHAASKRPQPFIHDGTPYRPYVTA
ncbi:hypothetical protein ACQEU5_10820 [Marinactinospora thermotolerans]|uniref:Uncharacterized protein n=1 Tax=Marinactinospora thermotolerans DSM 45154 TaxID=1122192 RepID=A0A1T4TJ81_9ACTN|nr:hypothetical protein [Marinactinospora thermotolerans]SKA40279.1 hypothetical protein SAMN02745673_05040 [Marinactinospora thermotolerans DSM 45154]